MDELSCEALESKFKEQRNKFLEDHAKRANLIVFTGLGGSLTISWMIS